MPYERSGGRQCVVYDCKNNQKKIYDWKTSVCEQHDVKKEDCPCLKPFKLHTLPRETERRREWLRCINRKDFNPSSKSVVCSVHFIDGRPTKENPNPTINMGYNTTKPVTPGRRILQRKVKESTVCKNILKINTKENIGSNGNPEGELKSELTHEYFATPLTDHYEEKQCDTVCCHLNPDMCDNLSIKPKVMCEIGTQTEDLIQLDHSYSYPGTTRNIQQDSTDFDADSVNSDSDAKFYTGLKLTVFLNLLSILVPLGEGLPYAMEVKDQILMTLMRFRLGLTLSDLGRRFNISRQLASIIIQSWIDIMAISLKDCIIWLPRATIRKSMPKSFKDSYPETTCIIDCSEIYIQRPFSLKARAQTWSTYKSHNTAKFLIAIAPNGLIMFISSLYGGRASDNFITKSCGFLNRLLPGDEVMADRGFTIGEELCSRRVKLNIPAFMKGRKQLSEQEMVESRRIASVRIHVERAIMRIKTYRILSTTKQIKSLKNLDKTLTIIAALCNMQDPLIKDTVLDN